MSLPPLVFRVLCLGILGLSTAVAAADDPAEAPKTHTVKRGPFKVVVDLPGVFESQQQTEVRLQPKTWSTFIVEKALPQGARVSLGDPIIWFETEAHQEAVEDAAVQLELARLTLEQAELELQTREKSVPLDLQAAERAHQQATEDRDHFLKFGEEQRRIQNDEMLKMAQERVEYAAEELEQLEKMYKADDLTEETEEIILLRTRRDVEHAKVSLESTRIYHERAIKLDLPREKVGIEQEVLRQQINLARALASLPDSVTQQRLELKKAQIALQQAEQKLGELKADGELLTVKAPADGVLRYGECDRGKWTTASQLESQLRAGGSVQSQTTLCTIVSEANLRIRVDLPEAQLEQCTAGRVGVVIPTGFPRQRLAAKLERVDLIAVREGTYDGEASFTPAANVPLTAGQGCTLKLTVHASEDAVVVPSSLVFTDDNDDAQKFVYRAGTPPQKQPVVVGHVRGDQSEILEGLTGSEQLLLEKPKAE